MFKIVFVWFFVLCHEVYADSKKIEPMNIKISVSGLHSKFRDRELIFKDNKTVFEKVQKEKESLMWEFFSVFYYDVQKYNLLDNEDKKLAKTFTACNEVVKFEISNSRKKKTFEVCDSPKQKGKIAEKIIKWKDFLLN